MSVSAIILAAGIGERFGGEKQFARLNGKIVTQYSIDVFRACSSIDKIIVVANDVNKANQVLKDVDKVVAGGFRRQDSSYNGLLACDSNTEYVLIHDASRPMITKEMIERLIDTLNSGVEGVALGWPAVDTISLVDKKGSIISIPDRRFVRRHQTPQGFDYKKILKAYESVPGNITFTDDVSVFKYAGYECRIIPGDEINIKITTPVDLFIAERISQWRSMKVKIPRLSGKRVLVFGGTGGIGKEVVKLLHQNGAEVVSLGKKDADLRVEKLPDWMYAVSWDTIIHCAGVLRKNTVTLDSLKDFDEMMTINARSLILICDLATKTMKEGGSIVVIGSSSAWKGRKGYTYYSASKAALNNLVEGLSEELAPYRIRINCVNPSRTRTASIREFYPNDPDDSFLDPAYVAKVVVSLCFTNETGQIINIRKNMSNFMEEYVNSSTKGSN
ncbi:MAG: 2-C-methyl-D-erythritol 4-phosphate cytidylyltransferase [Methanomassiliicoccales archaeon]